MLDTIGEWFVSSNGILHLIGDCCWTIDASLNVIKNNSSPFKNANNKKKFKYQALIGYEIWNLLAIISRNQRAVTFMSLFDTHIFRASGNITHFLEIVSNVKNSTYLCVCVKSIADTHTNDVF